MHKLTIKEVDGLIDYLQRPAATIGRAEGLAVYMQLADTLRENEKLTNELRIAKALILKEVHARAVESIEQTYKDSDNG